MIFRYYTKWKLAALAILGIIASTQNIVMAYVLEAMTNALADKNLHELPRMFLVALILFLIVLVAELGYNYLKNDAVREVNTLLRAKILEGMLETSKEDNASALGFLTNDFKLLEANRFNAEINIVFYFVTVALSLIYAIYINMILTVFFLIGSTLPILVSALLQKPIRKASNQWTEANSRYVNQIKNILAGTDTLKLYHKQANAVDENLPKVSRLEQTLCKMNLLSNNIQTVVGFVGIYGTFVIPAYLGGLMVLHGQTTMGVLFAIVQLSNSFVNPLMQILEERNHLSTTKDIVKKVNYYLDLSATKKLSDKYTFNKQVNWQNICLVRDQKQLLNGLNLMINPGEKIAVIGPSGSGKSTLLYFLMSNKFGKASNILIDNQKVKADQISDLFAYSSQAPVIFADTLWFNLTLGEKLPVNEVEHVCEQLELNNMVEEKGFGYQLGDNADKLSGGQLARIELARAILSKRPILLLDEINASLDQATSAAIHQILLDSNLTFVEVIHHYQIADLNKYDQVINLAEYQDR
ncbi:ABC transporter ATP-binding protein [Lactobacillus panisapium]|uniref:ATP-binding cassette domain-containing protein n=1 Tax=Lactobacillus panisapium TaxID=2012495 RepID=UPI001C6A615C|nr:ABC transporter ATP-binding protein [Lactobacillus panisapium]QYN57203.1 ABC transporter ATP-binding protein [Lactobacillus panisapium]